MHTINNLSPIYPYMATVTRANHPGQLLGRWLKDKWLSQRKFATIIWKSYVDINNIIHGKKDINVDFAIRIWLALHTSPDVWLGMQKDYDLYKMQQSKNRHEYALIPQRAKELEIAS